MALEKKKNKKKEKNVQGGRTCNSQVGVCLDLSCEIAGEALKHPCVVWQEAVDLQAASHQHSVPGDLYRADGHRVLIPHDVWLRCACAGRRGLFFSSSLFFPPSLTPLPLCHCDPFFAPLILSAAANWKNKRSPRA